MADDTYFQNLVDNADPSETIVVPWQSTPYELTQQIEIDKGLTFDFNGNTIEFAYDSSEGADGVNKGFKIENTTQAERIIFRNGIMLGADTGSNTYRNHLGPVITSVSGQNLELDLYQIESMVFKNLSYGVSFNCTNGGFIRNAVLVNNVFDTIIQKNVANDPLRGKGANFAMNSNKSVQMSGFSSGNMFRKCERHAMYASQGGPFVSIGDSFIDNGNPPTTPSFVLGTLLFGRNSHMRVFNGYFSGNRNGIVLSTETTSIAAEDVWIDGCEFRNSVTTDIILHAGSPATTGIYRNVMVSNTRHLNDNPASVQISVNAFDNMVLRNIDIEIDQGSGTTFDYGSIYVYAYGNSDDLVIDGVKFRYSPVPGTTRGIVLLPDAYSTSGNSPRLRIRNIETNESQTDYVYYSGSASQNNPNMVVDSVLP